MNHVFVRQASIAALAVAATLVAGTALAQDLKIALIAGKTGALEAYAKQTETGFMMGLEYLTKGTMTWEGRKIVVIVKDDQLKPDSRVRCSSRPTATTRSISRSVRLPLPQRSRCCRSRRTTRRC